MLLLAAAGAFALQAATAAPAPPPPPVGPSPNRPNIILVLADDLDHATMDHMSRLRSLLTEAGTSFSSFLLSDSLCCPSRTSILRGQYIHNHHVETNNSPEGGFQKMYEEGLESSTVATWLKAAGYRTGYFGKYLNGYPRGAEPDYVPPGWSEWYSPAGGDPYGQFAYALNENRKIVSYGRKPADYLTDVLVRKVRKFIQESVRRKKPFFVHLAPYAPHRPSTPAPRYAHAFAGATAPRPESFNETDVGDKPSWLRQFPLLTDQEIAEIDETFRQRNQSMLAVEDLVGALFGALEAWGQLDRTYVIFTSDNGFHLGVHRLLPGKQTPYEEDIRVPLIVRGPGVPERVTREHLVGNIDLAPTIADLAGAPVPGFVDGRSFAPLLRSDAPAAGAWRKGFLLEHARARPASSERAATLRVHATGPQEPPDRLEERAALKDDVSLIPRFEGIRTMDTLYVEYATGEKELYDLLADPLEMDNLASSTEPARLAKLSAWLDTLRSCAGNTCRQAEDHAP